MGGEAAMTTAFAFLFANNMVFAKDREKRLAEKAAEQASSFCDEADTAEPEPEPEPEPESVLGGGAVVAEAEASMEATRAAARARHGLAAGSDSAAAGPAS